MLERFRSSKPVSHQLHKNDYDWHSSSIFFILEKKYSKKVFKS
jgi:hypothetical protein